MGVRNFGEPWRTFLTSASRILAAERMVILWHGPSPTYVGAPTTPPAGCLDRLLQAADGACDDRQLTWKDAVGRWECWHGVPLPSNDNGHRPSMLWACWGRPADLESLARLREMAAVARTLLGQTTANAFSQGVLRTFVHELRTPLTIIRGYADLLRSGHALPESLKTSALAAMLQQTDRHEQLISEFTSAVGLRQVRHPLAPVDLPGTLLAPLESAHFTVARPDQPLVVPVAADELQQSLKRLCRIMPHLGRQGTTGTAEFKGHRETVTLTLTVTTERPPLDEIKAVLAHQPDTDQRARHGWTLTLLAVQEAMARQGGRLAIEHQPPQLIFRLTWPRYRPGLKTA